MIPRLAFVFIFVFCGTMTTLLVRSVLYPEESRLATVSPRIPFDLFVARTEGSGLDLWDGNRITGNCRLTPLEGGLAQRGRKDSVVVRVEVAVRLRPELLGAALITLTGKVTFHADGNIDDLDNLVFAMNRAGSPVRLTINQPRGAAWPALKLTSGTTTLFESAAGQTTDARHADMVNLLLGAAGLSPGALLPESPADPPPPATVRAGRIEAGGEHFDGYYLAAGKDDASQFRLYMANTGEILRIETPLGLRLLAESLRPKGVDVPVLNSHPPPAP